jgi:hypothetical protein
MVDEPQDAQGFQTEANCSYQLKMTQPKSTGFLRGGKRPEPGYPAERQSRRVERQTRERVKTLIMK